MHVLVVDENAADARLMCRAIHEAGIRVRLSTAAGRNDALTQICGDRQGRPDLVLLDVNNGSDSGWDILRHIKSDPALKSLPVVVLTDTTDPDHVDRIYEHQANCCMAKPGGFESCVELARSLLLFWTGVARLPGPGTPDANFAL